MVGSTFEALLAELRGVTGPVEEDSRQSRLPPRLFGGCDNIYSALMDRVVWTEDLRAVTLLKPVGELKTPSVGVGVRTHVTH